MTRISDQGEFDPTTRLVKWGPFLSATPRQLSYDLLPARILSEAVRLIGSVSIDGQSEAIPGNRQIRAASRVESIWRLQNGQFALEVRGRAGASYVVEASPDLVNWLPIATGSTTDGTLRFSDPESTRAPQRFYRIQAR